MKNILIGATAFVSVLALCLASYGVLVGGQSGQQDLSEIQSQISKLERKVFATGGTTNYDNMAVRGLQVGTTTFGTGNSNEATTSISRLLMGMCELIGTNVTVTASTTAPFDCVAPGVITTDFILSGIATTTKFTTANSNGFIIVGAAASTTNGFITFLVSNATGSGRNPSTSGFGSSTIYMAFATTSPRGL